MGTSGTEELDGCLHPKTMREPHLSVDIEVRTVETPRGAFTPPGNVLFICLVTVAANTGLQYLGTQLSAY